MNRGLFRAAVAAALLAVPAVPALAGPAKVGCLSVVDPKGDTAPAADSSLDLTGFTLKNEGKRLVATVTVDKAAVRPTYAPDVRMDINFTVGSKRVTLFAKNSLQRTAEANVFVQQGLRIKNAADAGEGTLVSGAPVEATFSGNTLTLKIKQTDLRVAVAEKTDGVPFTGIQALARANYIYYDGNVNVDSADAKAEQKFVGGARC